MAALTVTWGISADFAEIVALRTLLVSVSGFASLSDWISTPKSWSQWPGLSQKLCCRGQKSPISLSYSSLIRKDAGRTLAYHLLTVSLTPLPPHPNRKKEPIS